MLDAILLEQEQVPAVPVITHLFRDTAQAMADSWGANGFPVAETPHPVAGLSQSALDQAADALVGRVLDALCDPRRPLRE
ncbi:MAG: hypothetical protein ACHQZQ_04205 [SAR324 cluster bacterium]